MSIAAPQNRNELIEYALYKLGKPVLQVNVSNEQCQICVEDAIQFFTDRQHFNATETVLYRFKVTPEFIAAFKSARQQNVTQVNGLTTYESGMVTELTLVDAGSGYPEQSGKVAIPTLGGSGTGLTVNYGTLNQNGGLATLTIYGAGSGYQLGDQITVAGGNNDAVYEVTEVSASNPTYEYEIIEQQRNYVNLPSDVIGVNTIVAMPTSALGGIGMMFANAYIPIIFGPGGITDPNGFGSYDIGSSYTIFKQYLEDLNYILVPPHGYEFNQRTHRLHLNFDVSKFTGKFIVFECQIKPDYSTSPDMWNDMWLKRYATALIKKQWGLNLTKFQGVQLPGGLTMNGDRILNDALSEIEDIKNRFYTDESDWACGFLA